MRIKTWHAYLVIFIVLIGLFLPVAIELNRAQDEFNRATLKSFPEKSFTEISNELAAISKELKKTPADIEKYWELVFQIESLRGSTQALIAKHPTAVQSFGYFLTKLDYFPGEAQAKYREKFGLRKIGAAHEKYFREHPEKRLSYPRPDFSKFWSALKISYFHSLSLMLMFFFVRIYGARLSILLEAITIWRLALAVIFWPIGVFVYPDADTSKQMIRALRFAAFILGSTLSCFAGATDSGIKKPGNPQNSKKSTKKISGDVDHVALELFPVTINGISGAQISPEYGWNLKTEAGDFSGFGFFEWRKDIPWFTDHSVSFSPKGFPSFLSITAEQGAFSGGKFFQGGATINLNQVPRFGSLSDKIFNFISLSHMSKIAGTNNPNETTVVWSTKAKELGPFKIHSDGFYRIRGGGRNDFGQPQIWVHHRKLPKVLFGTELETAGGKIFPLFGMKFAFR